MLTPQDITDKVFVKAVFGGYDMTGVDEFLEEISTDYTALYKENAILKGKLKVLVEKVEEYRSTEDAMRMALLTAQRMGDEIMSDANKEKDQRLQNADSEAKARLEEAARRVADEEMRLSVAAKETAKFIELSQAIIKKHSEFLTKLETARRTVRPLSERMQAAQGSQQDEQAAASAAQQHGQASQQGQAASTQRGQVSQREQPKAQPQQTSQRSSEQQAAGQTNQPRSQQETQSSRENEIADTAEQIENAIEKMTGTGEGVGRSTIIQAAYDDDDDVDNDGFDNDDYDNDDIDTDDIDPDEVVLDDAQALEDTLTPRPKFDFDNLQFGENFAGGK